jgi:hypothetical protein
MVKFLSNRPEQPKPSRIENASLPAHDATEGLRNLAGKPRPAHHPGRGFSLRRGQGTGVHTRKLFILAAVAFALVSIGAATVVTTALTSDAAMAQAVR